MITADDLKSAIAECQGRRNPDAATCIKLASFLTIKDHLFPETPEKLGHGTQEQYSYAPAPEGTIFIESSSEFADMVNGRSPQDVWPVIDELMSTLQILQPRIYNAVMKKLY